MVWQDVLTPSEPGLDADQEQEARLAAQARAGAEWALTALIARYQPPVVRYLTRLTGSQEQARVQAERIFIRMERRLHGPHGAQHLRLWLLRACTEAGLDALRHPRRKAPPRLGAPLGPKALLTEHADSADDATSGRLKNGLGKLAKATQSTSRQVRQLIWTIRSEATGQAAPGANSANSANSMSGPRNPSPLASASELDNARDDDLDTLDPREALRHRLVRVVLAELPYGDAQCLALHLVAGLNQAEVAHALGLTASATRRRIVQGLQTFSARYASSLATMGVSPELGYQRAAAHLPEDAPSASAPALAGAAYNSLSDMETLRRLDAERVVESVEQEPTIGRLWPPAAPEPTHAAPVAANSQADLASAAQFAPVADEQLPREDAYAPAASVSWETDETPTIAFPNLRADEPDAYATSATNDSFTTDGAYEASVATDAYADAYAEDGAYAANDNYDNYDAYDIAAAMTDATLPSADDATAPNADTVASVDWEPTDLAAPAEQAAAQADYADATASAAPATEYPAHDDVADDVADDDADDAANDAANDVAGYEAPAAEATYAASAAVSTQPAAATTTDADEATTPGEAASDVADRATGAASEDTEEAAEGEDDGVITQPSLRRIAARQRLAAEAAARAAAASAGAMPSAQADEPSNATGAAQPDDDLVYRADSDRLEPVGPDRVLAERLARIQRNGAVSPMAHDAIVGPVIDALPVAPATGPLGPIRRTPTGSTGGSARRQTSQPLTFEMAAALAPVWITPAPRNDASAGRTGAATPNAGAHESADTALAYESPQAAEPDESSEARNDHEQA